MGDKKSMSGVGQYLAVHRIAVAAPATSSQMPSRAKQFGPATPMTQNVWCGS